MSFPKTEKAYISLQYFTTAGAPGKNSEKKNDIFAITFFRIAFNIFAVLKKSRPRSTMDSIRVSEAPDPGSIPGEATDDLHIAL